MRKVFFGGVVAAATAVVAFVADGSSEVMAQSANSNYPERAITWITPFSTGGQLDVMSRAIARPLEAHLGQPVVVRNIGGGGGTVGLTELANAEPDGYTVGLIPITMLSVSPHRMDLSYDIDSFDYFTTWGNMPMGIAVVDGSAHQTLGDLIDAARESRLTVVSTAPGGAQSLLLHMLNAQYETQFVEIPAQGGGEGVAAVMGGHTDAIISNPSILTGGDQLRLLASVSSGRWPNRPDVETAEEQGFSMPSTDVFVTTAGPAGLPSEVVDAWNTAIAEAMKDPDFIDAAERFAMLLVDEMSGDDFRVVAREQYEGFGPIFELLD